MFKGDDTQAFGGDFLTINLDNPNEYIITKASVRIGTITKTIENPIFPLVVNLTSEETEKLANVNNIYMALWDSSGRKLTVKGTLQFEVCAKVV